MRLGIKGKQVLGVTTIVGAVVIVLSVDATSRAWRRSASTRAAARADLLANAIFHRAREVVREDVDPYQALATDSGLRSILEASLYSEQRDVRRDRRRRRRLRWCTPIASLEGRPLRPGGRPGAAAVAGRQVWQLLVLYLDQGRNLEFRQPLLLR